AAKLILAKDEKTGKWKAEYDFGEKADLGSMEPFWTDSVTGAPLSEAGANYSVRERAGDDWKQVFRVGRLMCKKEITREIAMQLAEKGKTDLIKGFTSKKGRPFDAFLVRKGPRIAWEFPARAPKNGKAGKTGEHKARRRVDLSTHRAV